MARPIAAWVIGVVLAVLLPFNVSADDKPLRFAVTDLEGLESLQREFGAFRDALVKFSGVEMDFFAVPNRTAAVEAMRAGKIDLVLTGPAEYVIFKTRTQAVPVAAFSRPDYFADIVVMAESGIDSVADLKGKTMAVGDVGSTSKHLAPIQIIKDNGLTPGVDVKILHTAIKLGWEGLKRGDVAAWGMTNDKYLKLRAEENEVPPGAFKVIARGRDLPNDVLLAHPSVPAKTLNAVRAALKDHSAELVQAILVGDDNKKFTGMKFLLGVADKDYNYVREMYETAGHKRLTEFMGN